MCIKCEMNRTGDRPAYSVRGTWGTYTFDVQAAQRTVLDGREPYLIPSNVLEKLLTVNQPIEEHIFHVSVASQKPGIIARLGNRVALLDGTHRAALARREGRPYYAYMLSQRESEDCMIGFPMPKMA
jgi:hypothetical protein